MESQLVVSSIWEDESLFEISIFGSNGQFSGQANCYTNREEINHLGRLLEKFPKTTKDEIKFKSRSTPDLSYFSIHAFCTDNSGHTMFAVTIAHIESFTNARNENYKVNFDMKVEPQAICNFGIQLQRLAVNPLGKTRAVLKNAI